MTNSKGLGDQVGELAAGTARVVVEGDSGGGREEPAGDACAEPRSVRAPWRSRVSRSLKVQKMALDRAGGSAPGSARGRARPCDSGRRILASSLAARTVSKSRPAIALVADHGQRAVAGLTRCEHHLQADVAFVRLSGWSAIYRSGGAVQGAEGVQPKAVELAAVAGAVAVVGGVAEGVIEAGGAGALDRLAGAGALHRGGVDQQQVVFPAWAMGARTCGDQRTRSCRPAGSRRL